LGVFVRARISKVGQGRLHFICANVNNRRRVAVRSIDDAAETCAALIGS
jgi:hypothetical protein